MAKFKKIAKRTAQALYNFVDAIWDIFLYVFYPSFGALLALILAGVTKRTYYEWFDRIVGDFTDWSEDVSNKIEVWLNDNEF